MQSYRNELELAAALKINENRVCLVGSKRIVGLGAGNDWDFLVLLGDADEQKLTALGFKPDLDESFYPSAFRSWRNGDTNLIVTDNRSFFIAECTVAIAAAEAASAHWDLSCRDGRVCFHGAVRNGVRHHLDARIPLLPAVNGV
jgi:hypothetical protein